MKGTYALNFKGIDLRKGGIDENEEGGVQGKENREGGGEEGKVERESMQR